MGVNICPVCFGVGRKKRGFYPDSPPRPGTTNEEYVLCRSCGGSGIIKETAFPPQRAADGQERRK